MEKRYLVIGIILLIIILAIGGLVYYLEKKQSLIGGCAGVSSDNLQECCDNWAKENNIIRIQCVGEWEIKDNGCAWKCGQF